MLVRIFGCKHGPLWRGGLPPLGRAAAPNPDSAILQMDRAGRVYDCFAAERGQAPSPQWICGAFTAPHHLNI
ncbi:hypothetical protein B7L09_19670 [Pseudomonas mandelii]|nr:hypothetical protein B7L09_19670 [Pseudomonas mandelii]